MPILKWKCPKCGKTIIEKDQARLDKMVDLHLQVDCKPHKTCQSCSKKIEAGESYVTIMRAGGEGIAGYRCNACSCSSCHGEKGNREDGLCFSCFIGKRNFENARDDMNRILKIQNEAHESRMKHLNEHLKRLEEIQAEREREREFWDTRIS